MEDCTQKKPGVVKEKEVKHFSQLNSTFVLFYPQLGASKVSWI